MADNKNKDAFSAFANALTPIITEIVKNAADKNAAAITETVTVSSQELMLAIQQLEARIKVIEQAEPKKKVTRTDTKKNASPVAHAENEKVPGNKLAFFRREFSRSADFRAKYYLEQARETVEAHESVMKKTTEDMKNTARSLQVWKYIKDNEPKLMESISAEFDECIKNATAKPPTEEKIEEKTPQ